MSFLFIYLQQFRYACSAVKYRLTKIQIRSKTSYKRSKTTS